MATGTVLPPPPPPDAPARKLSARIDSTIDRQILRTRRQLKGVEIAHGLLALAVGTLGYLLVAAWIDHWLVSGGLGFWGRLALMTVLAAGAAGYAWARVVPLLVHRINPLYVAQTIEVARPSLKNSVLNFLLLRREPRGVPELVYRAVQQRAADDLAQVEVEAVVDRRPAIRLGYALAAVLAVASLYLALSPKSPLVSFGRVIWPWADIPAPTRVRIDSVEPGDTAVARGDPVQVAANVRGLAEGEEAAFYYSTADGQVVDQAIPMRPVRPGEPRHVIPVDSFVARQDAEYYVKAGDCTTRRFKIEAHVAPVIVVDRLTYDYPAYTGLPRAVVEGQGDVRAIEGTKVTVRATANLDVARAEIDLGCDGRHAVAMKIDGRTATGQITLRTSREDPSQPEFRDYQVRFADADGRENRRPTRHQIQVVPDLAPRVELALGALEEVPEEVQLPAGGSVDVRVSAEDPDFGLRRVALVAQKQGAGLPIAPLLDVPRGASRPGHRGPFQGTYRFEPARLGLKPGDVVVYWALAEDNKLPLPNRAETERRRIVIVEPPQRPQPKPDQDPREDPPQPGDAEPKPGEQGDAKPEAKQDPSQRPEEKAQQPPQEGPAEAQPNDPSKPDQDDPPPEPKPGEQAEAKAQAGEQDGTAAQEEQPREHIDPLSNPREAFEKIIEDQKQQEQQQQQQQQQEQPKPGQEQPEPKPGGKPQAKPQAGEQPPGQEAQPADQQPGAEARPQAGEQPGEPQPGDKPQPGEPKPGPEQPQPADGQKPDDSQGRGSQTGDKPAQKVADNQQPASAGEKPEQGEKPPQGQGVQARDQGMDEKPQPGDKPEGPGPDQQGGDPQAAKSDPGQGSPSQAKQGPPEAQEDNLDRGKKPGEKPQGEPSQNEAQSPTTSKHQSDSQSDSSGDRSGGGEEGGGQQTRQQGTGSPGSQSEAEQGAGAAGSKGEGEPGTKPGEQVESRDKTGQSARKKGGPGTETRDQPGPGAGEKPQDRPGEEGGRRAEDGQQGAKPRGESPEKPNAHGAGNPAAGGLPQQPSGEPAPAEPMRGEDPNLQYARKATDMALEHLREQLREGDLRVLEKLRWTREDADRFLRRWEDLKRQAAEEGPGGEAQRQLDEALKNLGLRPGGTAIGGGRAKPDDLRRLRESRNVPPPPDWAEQFRAFKMGIREREEK